MMYSTFQFNSTKESTLLILILMITVHWLNTKLLMKMKIQIYQNGFILTINNIPIGKGEIMKSEKIKIKIALCTLNGAVGAKCDSKKYRSFENGRSLGEYFCESSNGKNCPYFKIKTYSHTEEA